MGYWLSIGGIIVIPVATPILLYQLWFGHLDSADRLLITLLSVITLLRAWVEFLSTIFGKPDP